MSPLRIRRGGYTDIYTDRQMTNPIQIVALRITIKKKWIYDVVHILEIYGGKWLNLRKKIVVK